jgi:inosine-uridine nucleoside N-ribohydrolase
MTQFPHIPDEKMRRMLAPPAGPVRLILDTDAYNEIDDQYAIAWALLSQDQLQIEGVVAEPYSQAHRKPQLYELYDFLLSDPGAPVPSHLQESRSWVQTLLEAGTDPHDIDFVDPAEGMELSYQEILNLYEMLEQDPAGKVFRGSDRYLESLDAPVESPAAEFIIERALAGEEQPLYIAAIGCVTNIASAILLEPKIIERIVVLWTSAYPSVSKLDNTPSLNMVQDILSSQLLFDCGVPHVYLPGYHVGAQLLISLPEMERYVRGKGAIGDYLHHLYTHNSVVGHRNLKDLEGCTWVIWDLINFAWLLNPDWVPSHLVRAPILTDDLYWEHDPGRHLMREAYKVNRDAIFRDFYQKLKQAP